MIAEDLQKRIMSKQFRGMSQPQMTHLRPGIALIEHSDPGAEAFHISTNTYALLREKRMLLVDTNVSSLLPFVRVCPCCIRQTTEACCLQATQRLEPQPTRQKLAWNA